MSLLVVAPPMLAQAQAHAAPAALRLAGEQDGVGALLRCCHGDCCCSSSVHSITTLRSTLHASPPASRDTPHTPTLHAPLTAPDQALLASGMNHRGWRPEGSVTQRSRTAQLLAS